MMWKSVPNAQEFHIVSLMCTSKAHVPIHKLNSYIITYLRLHKSLCFWLLHYFFPFPKFLLLLSLFEFYNSSKLINFPRAVFKLVTIRLSPFCIVLDITTTNLISRGDLYSYLVWPVQLCTEANILIDFYIFFIDECNLFY